MDGSIADSTMLRIRSGLMRSGQTLANSSTHSFFEELLRLPVTSAASDKNSNRGTDRASDESPATPPTSIDLTTARSDNQSDPTVGDTEEPVSDEAPTDDQAASLVAVAPIIVCCFAPETDVNPAPDEQVPETLVSTETVVEAEGHGSKRGQDESSPQQPVIADSEPDHAQAADVMPALVHAEDVSVHATISDSTSEQDLAPVKAASRVAVTGGSDENVDDSVVRSKVLQSEQELQSNTDRRELATDVASSEVVPQEITPRPAQSMRERRALRSTTERDKWYANRSNESRSTDGSSRDKATLKTQRDVAQDPALMQEMLAHLEPVTQADASIVAGPIDALLASAMTPAALAALNSMPNINYGSGSINSQINAQIRSDGEMESGPTAASSDSLRNLNASDGEAGGGVTAMSNAGATGPGGSGTGGTGSGGTGAGTGQGHSGQGHSGQGHSGQGHSGPAGLDAAGRMLADGASGFDVAARNGDQVETRQLSQQERVRLVQRVARSFSRIGPDGGQVSLRLHPPELGVLNVSIKIEGQAMTARLQTESGAARDVILESLPVLKERLSEQGIEVEKFQVDVVTADALGSGQSQMSDTAGGGARGGQNEARAEGQDYRRVRRGELADRSRAAVDHVAPISLGPTNDRSLDVRA